METIDREFLQYLESMGKAFGLSDLPLQIFGIIYLEPGEISMEEIANKTGYSLASISNTMKMLEKMGQVQRIRKPGTKKAYFSMDKDMASWNIKKLEYTNEFIIKPAKVRLPSMIKRYRASAKDEKSRKKIDIIEGYYRQLLFFEGLLEKWKKDLEKAPSR